MGVMELRRRIIENQQQLISNIPVYKNNAAFLNINPTTPGPRTDTGSFTDYFVAGPFDVGSSGNREYTFTVFPQWPGNKSVTIRTYDTTQKNETAISRQAVSYNTGTKTATLNGRYIFVTVYKPVADTSFMYYMENGVRKYLFKGKNVTT